jgi:hypothetical protein
MFNVEREIIDIISKNQSFDIVMDYIKNSNYIYTDMGKDSVFTNEMKSILFENHNCHGCIHCNVDEETYKINCSYYNYDIILSQNVECVDKVNIYEDCEDDWCMQEFHCKDIDNVIEKFLNGDIY